MTRGRVTYNVGVETNPGNPFGRSVLAIESDGKVRLDHHTRGGGAKQAWTGRVDPGALDRLWAAIEQSGFPDVPKHPVPAGATIRNLGVERSGAPKQSALVAWHAAAKLPGYAEAFKLLDQIVRQLSGNSVDRVPATTETLVTDIATV
jgi:hypothetical protein